MMDPSMDYEEGEIMDCSPIPTSTSTFTTHTALTPNSSAEVEDILLVSRGSDNRQPPSKSTQKIYRPPLSLLVPQSSAQGMREGQVSEDNMTRQDLLSPHQPQAYSDHPSTIYPDRIVRRVSNNTSRSSFPLEELKEIFSMPMPMMDRCMMIWELYESRSDIDMEISRIQEAHHKQLSVIQKRFDDRSLKIRDELVNLRQNLETSQLRLQKEAEEHQNTKETKNHLMIRLNDLSEALKDLKREKTEEKQKHLSIHSDLREQLRMKINHITEMGHQISRLEMEKKTLNEQMVSMTAATSKIYQAKISELNSQLEEEKKKDKSVLKHLQQIAQLHKDNRALKGEMSNLEARADEEKVRGDELEEELKLSNKSRIESEESAEKAMLSGEEIKKELIQVKTELCEAGKTIEAKENLLKDLETIRSGLVKELVQSQAMSDRRLQVEKSNLTQQFQVGINELRSQLERLEAEKGIINSSLITAQRQLQTVRSNLSRKEEENKALKARIRDLNKDIKDKIRSEKNFRGRMQRLGALKAGVEKLSKEVSSLKGQIMEKAMSAPPKNTPHLLNLCCKSSLPMRAEEFTSTNSNSNPISRASSPLSSAPPSPGPTTPRSIHNWDPARTSDQDRSTITPNSICDDQDKRMLVVISRSKLDGLKDELKAAKSEIDQLRKNNDSNGDKAQDVGFGATTRGSEQHTTMTLDHPQIDYFGSEEPQWAKLYKMQLRELVGVIERKKNDAFVSLLKRPRGAEEKTDLPVNKLIKTNTEAKTMINQ